MKESKERIKQINIKIANNLLKARLAAGFTLLQLAQKVDVAQQQILWPVTYNFNTNSRKLWVGGEVQNNDMVLKIQFILIPSFEHFYSFPYRSSKVYTRWFPLHGLKVYLACILNSTISTNMRLS